MKFANVMQTVMLFMACRAHCDRPLQPPARQPNVQTSCSSTQLLADLAARQTLMKVREVACIAERTCKDHASAVLEGMRLLVAPIVHRNELLRCRRESLP